MSYAKLLLFTCLGILTLACQSDPEISEIDNIIVKSDCIGPDGPYTTETHSTPGGYTYLEQHFGPSGDKFRAVTFNDSLGFLLGDTARTGLQPKEIFVVKSHDFHRIALFPLTAFDHACVTKCDTILTTKDRLDKGAVLVYNDNRLEEWIVNNPYVMNQQIRVQYSDFQVQQGIEVARKVRVLQGRSDTFEFDITDIEFNSDAFEIYEIR